MKPSYCGLYKNAVPLPPHLYNSCTLWPIASFVYFIFSTTEDGKHGYLHFIWDSYILYEISISPWVTGTLKVKLYNLIVAFFKFWIFFTIQSIPYDLWAFKNNFTHLCIGIFCTYYFYVKANLYKSLVLNKKILSKFHWLERHKKGKLKQILVRTVL